MGYYRAGFTDILGIDHRPQPRYPFVFRQADALEVLRGVRPGEYDLIHASPPCQAYTRMLTPAGRSKHPDHVGTVRTLLEECGCPWVIENVPGAPLRAAVILCGSHFGLRSGDMQLVRHRLFESPWLFGLLPPCDHHGCAVSICGRGTSSWYRRKTGRNSNKAEHQVLMGIDWMTRNELVQAIPPAYTEWVGRAILPLLAVGRRQGES
jgi:DNA (cytosine-5)-methyltransferase 1